MSALPFTDRELRKAWRELKFASQTSSSVRKNPQRLLLFYAVECGLKAVWLKANNKNVLDATSIDTFKHDLSEIMRALGLGKQYFLPSDIYLNSCTIEKKDYPRNGKIDALHQAWRYGGSCTKPTDQQCEEKLQQIVQWIEKEL